MISLGTRFVDMSAHAKNVRAQEKAAAEAYTARAQGTEPKNDATTTPDLPRERPGVLNRVFKVFRL